MNFDTFYCNKKAGALFSVLLTSLLLICFYHTDISNANNLGYGVWGDGYKNFYTLAYYVKYDSGSHFTGMNYPYGENILFTDNQPLLAVALQKLAKVFPAIRYHIHLIVSALLFCSAISTGIILYLFLIELGVFPLLASVAGSFIALMSPNFDHFLSLYSLAYTQFIPLLLYLVYKFIAGKQTATYAGLGIATVLCFTFIHLYFLAIALLFIASVCMLYPILIKDDYSTIARKTLALLSVVVVPLISLKLYLFFTDNIKDRPENPWGYLAGYSKLHYILFHPNSVLYFLIQNSFPTIASKIKFGYDAKCYLGLSCIVLLFIGSFLFLKKKLRNEKLSKSQNILLLLLAGSIPVLLFAMAIPFQFKSFEPLYNALPNAIKQFRAAARFSWVFYYTASIVSVVVLNYLLLSAWPISKVRAYVVLFLFLGVWLVDIITTNNYQEKNFKEFSVQLNESNYHDTLLCKLKELGYSPQSFQSILTLPYYHVGSEKICIASSKNFASMQTSFITGLPLFCCQMSRTSISQTLSLTNLFSSCYIKKDVISKLNDNRPILVISGGTDLSPQEKLLREKSKYLFTYDKDDFSILPISAFTDSVNAIKNIIKTSISFYTKHGTYLSTSGENNTFFEGYEQNKNSNRFAGIGAKFCKEESLLVYEGALPYTKDSSYEFSIWFYADSSLINWPLISLTEKTSTKQEQIQKIEFNSNSATESYDGWIRASINFTLKNSHDIISISSKSRNALYDNLLIRPTQVDVVTNYKNDSSFFFNNYPIY